MEIKEVKTVLIGALEKPENDSMKVKYADSITEYLKGFLKMIFRACGNKLERIKRFC